MTATKVLARTGELEFDVPYRDKDLDQVRVKKSIRTANQDVVIFHRLGRVPNRVFVDWATGGFPVVKVSLDSSGREQADDDKVVVQFSATGIAVVCIA